MMREKHTSAVMMLKRNLERYSITYKQCSPEAEDSHGAYQVDRT